MFFCSFYSGQFNNAYIIQTDKKKRRTDISIFECDSKTSISITYQNGNFVVLLGDKTRSFEETFRNNTIRAIDSILCTIETLLNVTMRLYAFLLLTQKYQLLLLQLLLLPPLLVVICIRRSLFVLVVADVVVVVIPCLYITTTTTTILLLLFVHLVNSLFLLLYAEISYPNNLLKATRHSGWF